MTAPGEAWGRYRGARCVHVLGGGGDMGETDGSFLLEPQRPQIHLLMLQPPVPQRVTVFGDRAFKEVMKLKCGVSVSPKPVGVAPS